MIDDAEREKIKATLMNNLTNIARKYPDLTYEELHSIYGEVSQFLIKKGRLKRKRKSSRPSKKAQASPS